MESLDYSTFSPYLRSRPGRSCPKSPLCWILLNPIRLLVGLERSSLRVLERSNGPLEAAASSTAWPRTPYELLSKVSWRRGRLTSPCSPTRQIPIRRGNPNNLQSLLRSRTSPSRPFLLAMVVKKLAGMPPLHALDADNVSRSRRREERASSVHAQPLRTQRAGLKIGLEKRVSART